MSVIDKLSSISETLSEVFKFASENEEIKADFEEYLKTIGLYNAQPSQINSVMVTYLFERVFHKGKDTVFSMFLNENNNIDSHTKNIIEALEKGCFLIPEMVRDKFLRIYKRKDNTIRLIASSIKLSKEQIISLSNDVYRILVFGEISNLIQDEYIKFSDLLSLCNYLKKIDCYIFCYPGLQSIITYPN